MHQEKFPEKRQSGKGSFMALPESTTGMQIAPTKFSPCCGPNWLNSVSTKAIGAEKKVSQSTGARTLRHSSCCGWENLKLGAHSCSAKNNNKRRGPRSPRRPGPVGAANPDQPQPGHTRVHSPAGGGGPPPANRPAPASTEIYRWTHPVEGALRGVTGSRTIRWTLAECSQQHFCLESRWRDREETREMETDALHTHWLRLTVRLAGCCGPAAASSSSSVGRPPREAARGEKTETQRRRCTWQAWISVEQPQRAASLCSLSMGCCCCWVALVNIFYSPLF